MLRISTRASESSTSAIRSRPVEVGPLHARVTANTPSPASRSPARASASSAIQTQREPRRPRLHLRARSRRPRGCTSWNSGRRSPARCRLLEQLRTPAECASELVGEQTKALLDWASRSRSVYSRASAASSAAAPPGRSVGSSRPPGRPRARPPRRRCRPERPCAGHAAVDPVSLSGTSPVRPGPGRRTRRSSRVARPCR